MPEQYPSGSLCSSFPRTIKERMALRLVLDLTCGVVGRRRGRRVMMVVMVWVVCHDTVPV